MIIPSIDLASGQAVQLVGGERLAVEAGDPRPILERFALAGEVAVVDLDAARGEGSNADLMRALCAQAPVRIGGGVRDADAALDWLDAGAAKVVIGTAAQPELLRKLPRDRVIVALDSRDGDVVTHGWRHGTGRGVLDRMAELRDFCCGFLVTFVELEGRLEGTDLERAQRIVEAAGPARVTIAGGITTPEEIAQLDRLGADAQVGMALYTNQLGLAEALAAPLTSDRADGLWPTVVTDERGIALGLAYSSQESLALAMAEGRGVYQSRRRGIWRKGESSGAVQELLSVDLDCDRDTLRFKVRQRGTGFCHLETETCWGPASGLTQLERTLAARKRTAPAGSNTARLLKDPELLAAKLVEESAELAEATSPAQVRHEAADLLFFALARITAAGLSLADIEAELDGRALRVSRRPMEIKEVKEAKQAEGAR